MTFRDFLARLQALKVEESRSQTEEYFEAVLSKDSLDALHTILKAYFGPPLKPEGHVPSGKASRHAEPHGGIRKDQTMYFHQDGDVCEYALLWPWGSGTRITLKVIQSKSSGRATGLLGFFGTLFSRIS